MDISITEFIRTPNLYGFLNAAWIPNETYNIDLTGTYTGSMIVPRVISDSGFLQLNNVNPFFDLNLKIEAHFDFTEEFIVTVSGGVKNIFDSFQDDFDVGPTRDSDYIYGPAAPRTLFIGLKFGRFH
jgi:outer membrane receptor for ferrienterochelin and colicins